MKIKVENDRLLITRPLKDYKAITEIVASFDIKELAKALKPYLDSIPNCECKKDGLESVNI